MQNNVTFGLKLKQKASTLNQGLNELMHNMRALVYFLCELGSFNLWSQPDCEQLRGISRASSLAHSHLIVLRLDEAVS